MVQDIAAQEGVKISIADQCMYGLKTWTAGGREMAQARKRTKFMTNCQGIHEELQTRCNNLHTHQHLINGRAKWAARYPSGLCQAICRGLMKHVYGKSSGVQHLARFTAVDRVSAITGGGKKEEETKDQHESEEEWMRAWDDVTGQELSPSEVRKARMTEARYVEKKRVWRKITRREALRRGIKIIGTRWIDVNKGDKDHPDLRSRLVGQEFWDGKDESLFASMPPLEALRYLISDAATINDISDVHSKVVMVNDVSRAFFEAPVKKLVCVEIPPDMKSEEDEAEDMVGLLQMSMHGTRDASANFQAEVTRFMQSRGFE